MRISSTIIIGLFFWVASCNNYNNIAGDYNIAIKKIPASIVAGIGGFTEVALFKAEAGAETAPEVNF